ncbi:MAG: 8-amino-7-oxononanoate synthase [Pseudomonadota bacterium]|mgnify:CR=1 FL=1|nr:8-amino-7-oxononanoate synthase [Pseudomonadales bacterium]MDY6920134.1 8-amino-7-oxononanoate synthase [Pseudomonadota bacterium]
MSDPFALAQRLQARREQHLYRQRRILESPQQAHIHCAGRELINFSSNDYLGLASHPRLIQAFCRAAEQYGVGAGASHLVVGHSRLHQALEERLADWVGRPRALLFSTGYMANLGVITSLVERGDQVLQDKLNHASLLDAALLSAGRLQRYRHGDPAALEQRLLAATGRALVVTDSVFSMDGDLAPLPAMAGLCQRHNAWLMVDDAHGLGVLGEGHGVLSHCHLSLDQVPVYVGTLGKALGTFGAFVAGSEELIEFLIQSARSYIYTTAMPPAVAAATLEALNLVEQESWRLQQLQELIARFRRGAEQLGLSLLPSTSAIQPLVLGEPEQALAVSERLLAEGFLVGAIRPPTVPAHSARLRITLSAGHRPEDVDRLLESLSLALVTENQGALP